jgi:hypothetical protein
MIQADEKVPQVIWFSAATTHDSRFLDKISFKKDALYLFDKGYVDYLRYEKFIDNGISFVTRLKDNASYQCLEELDIPDHIDPGVIKDERIQLPIRKKWTNNKNDRITQSSLLGRRTKTYNYLLNKFNGD